MKSSSFAITLQRMSITLRWVGDDEADRVGDTRFLCYGSAEKDRESFRERLRNDPRSKAGLLSIASGSVKEEIET